jgi:hypothetical protein
MHLCGIACYAAAPDKTAPLLEAAAAGRHLSTLAFSETGSRSHFWAPVSRASGSGNGAVVDQRAEVVRHVGRPRRRLRRVDAVAGATQPLESSIYLVLKTMRAWQCRERGADWVLRGNASAPMTLSNVSVGADRALTG